VFIKITCVCVFFSLQTRQKKEVLLEAIPDSRVSFSTENREILEKIEQTFPLSVLKITFFFFFSVSSLRKNNRI
jgi:hypothetical protein